MEKYGVLWKEKARKLFPDAGFVEPGGGPWTTQWCLESDSNRHGRKAHEILSLTVVMSIILSINRLVFIYIDKVITNRYHRFDSN
jgi:hypothetical protein